MASFISPPPPPLKNNNLFGLPSSSVNANANDGASRTSSPSVSSSSSAAAAAAWFEDDDEALLSQLLLQSDDSDSNDNDNRSDGSSTATANNNLNDKLDRMLVRFEQDIISSGSGSDDNNVWWSNLMGMATSSGFVCTSSSSSNPAISRTTTSTFSSSSSISLPKAFHTPEGKAHIAALVDLLGVSKERAVRMTLASLRTFAKISTTTATTSTANTAISDDNDNHEDDDGTTNNNNNKNTNTGGIHSPTSPSFTTTFSPEQEAAARLRSLLGTKELFRQVLHFHRREFLIRLRILTECLRLEQEGKEVAKSNDDEDDDEDGDGLTKGRGKNWGISTSCARLLDQLDARLLIDIRCSGGSSSSGSSTNELLRRGIFHVLLKLATGPALPGLGGRELPYSVGKLRGNSSSTSAIGGGGGAAAGEDLEHLLSGSAEILHAIRQESAEALLVLLYDRIHGGVTRLDLFLIMVAASSLSSTSSSSALLEFGMTGREYVKVVRRRGRGGGGAKKVDATDHQQSKCTLDGLWALICAECMGLWRTTTYNDGGDDWVNCHPLLSGVADANTTDRNRVAAQVELKILWQKIFSLGEAARDRRGVAYNAYMQGTVLADGEIDDDDDALWGVRAPEGVILLAFGLLLRLASLEHPTDEFITEAGGWGHECTQLANDDCAAFSYLLRVLETTVQDPIIGSTVRKRDIGNDELVSNLLKRGAFEMLNYEERGLMTSDAEGICENAYDEDPSSQDMVVADATSVICASIGREILTSTIRVFRDSLLSLQLRSSAVENIGMLSDLASVVYRNSSLLCRQFWSSWEIFCQRGGGDMMENGAVDEIKDAEPMCYLLDASHSLAMSTLAELKAGGSPQAAIDYLKPFSSFLHLIASLCANPSIVRSILSSEFLPEGLFSSTMSVITALTPLISSISESEGRVAADKRRVIRHATVALESISTLAFLGGEPARAWIRQSLQHSALAAPHIICKIAFGVLSHRKVGLESEGGELIASSALNLLVDLLVGSDVAFQAETCACFAPSSTLALGRGDKMSGFAPLVSNGADSGVTLATMIILNCLSINLARNVFNQRDISSGAVLGYIETIGCGVMVALDLLSSFVLSSEVSFPTSKVQVATADSILASIVSTLLNLKQLGYLHENDEVRSFALAVRNDILNALSSSTSLGQAVAFVATVTVSTTILTKATKSRELSRVMDSAATQQIENEDSKYGAWKMFVTPKRTPASLSNDNVGNDKVDADMDLCTVSAIALCLILVWGEHSDDLKEPLCDQNRFSLCALLLSKASCSALHDFRSSLNVANLNLISRLASCSYDDVGVMSKSAMLSARIIKMCLRQTAFVDNIGFECNRTCVNLNDFRIALAGGSRIIFEALLAILDKHASDGLSKSYSKCMETKALLATVLLETVASSVSSHPDLARDFLLGGDGHDDWRLLDKIASCIASTGNVMNCSREEQGNVHDDRIVNIRYLLTCACVLVISELWRSCRLTSNLTHNSDSVHACGIITAYLTKLNKTGTTSVVANHVSELIRCSLLAIMAMEDNVTSQDVPIASVNQKCILLDLLSRSLDVITIEIICRVRTKSQGGIKFVEDLFDSFDTGPMDCWKELLTSSNADALAAASWLRYTMNVANWNITSFVQANPPEEGMSSSSWCSFGSSVSITNAVKPRWSESVKIVIHSNALHVLCQSAASFSASWATFFEVVAANVIATRSDKEKCQLTTRLVECSMAALESLAESKMVAASQLSGQGLIEIGGTKHFGELCTLLMYSITTRRDLMSSGDVQSPTIHFVQDMLGRLYVASNNIFVMTQLGSVLPSDQVRQFSQ